MKRLTELTPGDLARVPVWQYQGDIDETAVVRATDRTEVGPSPQYLVRTQFALADGSQHIGFCSASDEPQLSALQPVIVTSGGPVFLWFDDPPTPESLDLQWRRLGAAPTDIFPIHFRCTVPVAGQIVTGTIDSDDLTGAA